MFSWFNKKNVVGPQANRRTRGLLTEDAAKFLADFATAPSQVRPSGPSEPAFKVVTFPPTLNGIVSRISTDVDHMDVEGYTHMRWKVPDGVSASSVVKKCSGKFGKRGYKFFAESVGKLSYVTCVFDRGTVV